MKRSTTSARCSIPKTVFCSDFAARIQRSDGERAEPIAIGGGTYARALECGAGFGPQLCGEPVTIHQKDEYISIPHVTFLLNLYRRAVEELTK